MGEEMALEIMLSGKFRRAIGAPVLFSRWGTRAAAIIPSVGQTEPATRVIYTASRHGIRECFIAVLVDRILPGSRPVSILRG